MSLKALSLLCLLSTGLVVAQDTTSSASFATASINATAPTNATTTSASPITHTISVGYGGFTFSPDVTLAEVGDIIEYDFFPPNHSVARSEFGFPCIPYEDTGVDKIGFFSGFRAVDAIISDPPKFSIRVNDTNPILFYCTAPNSCIGHQMLGVINPNATTPLATQQALAANSSFMLQPGEPWPSESNDPFTTSSAGSEATSTSAAPTSTSATATAPAATTSAAAAVPSSHSGLTDGAIAGIAIGAAAVALLAAALLYMCGRQSRRHDWPQHGPPQQYMGPQSHMSYVHPKHMSSMTSNTGVYASSALPGYIPQHDPAMSPPLHQAFPTTDAIAPATASDVPASPSSPSPSHAGFAAPAYQQAHPVPMQPGQQFYDAPDGVHEMDNGQQGGTANFIRKASTRKAGVERYG